jgi:hypothetical protein
VLNEELAQFGVVDPVEGGELPLRAAVAVCPFPADGLGPTGLDRPWGESGLALRDESPGEGRGFLPFPVARDRPALSWD